MKNYRFFVRNLEAGDQFEIFLIFSIAAILSIRSFLAVTGYPQIGGDTLHIAHMLWGGLMMLLAIILYMSFLSKRSEIIAVVIGGIGFGTFIDEVGKFVTQDNNYFFQPSVAIIYAVFIITYLIIRGIQTTKAITSQEYLMNAIRQLEEVVVHDLDEEEKKKILHMLQKAQATSLLSVQLIEIVHRSQLVSVAPPGIYSKIKKYLKQFYSKIADLPVFSVILTAFFVVQFVIKFAYSFTLTLLKDISWNNIFSSDLIDSLFTQIAHLSLWNWAELLSSLATGIFTFIGVWKLPRSKISAYRMFERSILIHIFFTQIFIFYREQFSALFGFAFNFSVYGLLRFMINREQ